MTPGQPPGCNLRRIGQKGHVDNTFQALVSVDIIGGQAVALHFGRGGFRVRELVPVYCVNVELYTCKFYIYHPHRKYSNL